MNNQDIIKMQPTISWLYKIYKFDIYFSQSTHLSVSADAREVERAGSVRAERVAGRASVSVGERGVEQLRDLLT